MPDTKKPKLSRQREWQLKRREEGKCTRCGNPPLLTKNHCAKCARKQREYMRKKTNAKIRYVDSVSYQNPALNAKS